MTFQFGIDQLLNDPAKLEALQKMRVALVAHPASMTGSLIHTLDALVEAGCNMTCAFGPQHGMRGDKQDNMIESGDYLDPIHGIPVISLYGEHRRPTPYMLDDIDIVLFDLQDVGCRIYTYITTLKYFMEVAATSGKAFWVLDRPNPAGRPVDGLRLVSGEESFVGADLLPTRHGLTVGELAHWYKHTGDLDLELDVIEMSNYQIDIGELAWPPSQAWVNPSPNAASLNMARCFPGTVLLEGTQLSEGRGTTVPLEVIGAPDFPARDILNQLQSIAPTWCEGAHFRPCYFEPTFHKHVQTMCSGIQIHTDSAQYDQARFKPYRFIAGCLKVLRQIKPEYDLWRHHEYEYELDRVPIDVINGGPGLRTWVDDPEQTFEQLATKLDQELEAWLEERSTYLIY
jgi:uncharacterized protein YbbC (DUF1343 family)